jgi:hypothetical protein
MFVRLQLRLQQNDAAPPAPKHCVSGIFEKSSPEKAVEGYQETRFLRNESKKNLQEACIRKV